MMSVAGTNLALAIEVVCGACETDQDQLARREKLLT